VRVAGLVIVFVMAKVSALAGRHLIVSWWAPVAYLWQDALVALAFGAADFALRARTRAAWVLYAALAAYSAINIPVARVLSTPLTWLMWRAARGPLADSIWYYATWQNLALSASVLACAIAAPLVLRRTARRPWVVASALSVALGPTAAAHVDTRGLEQNAWTALLATALPRVPSRASDRDWRRPPFARLTDGDLSWLRGAAAGRNVVLVSLESTAAQYLGIYGADPEVTPNLSELARSAIVFDNAYAVYPESIKGLMSILCSTYPAFDSTAEEYASLPCRSIATLASDDGYRTALFHSGRFGYLGMDAVVRHRGFDTLADAGDIGGARNSSFGVDEPSTVSSILRWIDALPRGERFFVTYLPIAGHHPYETPDRGPFADADEFGRYRNALHYGDRSLGTLVRGLRARGLGDRTLWIVLGDHGEAFGQHEGNFGHTFQLYEENVHVPFLVAAPGLLAGPTHSRNVVSLVDAAPTLLDLVGLPRPAAYQGRSALDGEPRMALFFADYAQGLLGLRDGPRKFILDITSGREQLFDLDADAQERTSVAAREAALAGWYADDLRDWSAAQEHRLKAHP
jgi:phosphoglycerol transferase MdoB-like AlkP superfamily enzyme